MATQAISKDLRRVYLVSWWFADFGGMERHITELAKSLHNRGIEVTVFSEMPAPRANQYRTELSHAGIGFVCPNLARGPLMWWQARFPERRFPGQWGAGRAPSGDAVSRAMGGSLMARLLRFNLSRRLKRETPDVVHVHGWRLRQWVAAWCVSRGIPAIYTEHSTISDWSGPVDPRAPEWLAGAGDIACVSDAARKSLARWMPGRPLALHHHIVHLPDRPDRRVPDASAVRILTIARLRAEKGLDVLLRAAARLRSQGVEFRLEIAGDGPLRKELIELRGRLGLDFCVDFAGGLHASAVQKKLREADIFVLSSRTEALSLALLEAMAHGLAIVATAVGGIPEFIRDGETGLLAPVESVESLAEALRSLATDVDLRSRLGANARLKLESSAFSEASCIRSVLSSYDKARNGVPAE